MIEQLDEDERAAALDELGSGLRALGHLRLGDVRRPRLVAEQRGQLVPPGEERVQHLGVLRERAAAVRAPEPFAQRGDLLGASAAAVADVPGAHAERRHQFSGRQAYGFHGGLDAPACLNRNTPIATNSVPVMRPCMSS
jgi:hypothetical protein